MMKTYRRILTIVLSLMLTLSLSGIAAFAAEGDNLDNAGLTYTVTIYSGDSGTFKDGSTVKKITGLSYGDTVKLSINSEDYAPVLNKDAEKYYARGFKIAGHDNDEISRLQLVDYNYQVTGDESFTVAYGMKGGMVKYTVNYVDENGNTLHPSAEYYGMAGDYPVVSYQYVEGFAPNAYNLGKTLTANEADNVFTFTYAPSTLTAEEQAAAATQVVTVVAAGGNAGAGAAGAGGNAGAGAGAGAGAAGAGGVNIGDNATPAAGAPNVVDLDNGEVPQAEPETDEKEGELAGQKTRGIIIAGACAVLLAAIAAFALAKRKSEEDEDEDED